MNGAARRIGAGAMGAAGAGRRGTSLTPRRERGFSDEMACCREVTGDAGTSGGAAGRAFFRKVWLCAAGVEKASSRFWREAWSASRVRSTPVAFSGMPARRGRGGGAYGRRVVRLRSPGGIGTTRRVSPVKHEVVWRAREVWNPSAAAVPKVPDPRARSFRGAGLAVVRTGRRGDARAQRRRIS